MITTILIYARPPLVFAAMLCAVFVMLTRNPVGYVLGVLFLFTSMAFDLLDGWFADRYRPDSKFVEFTDRVMDKIVYSIIFPLVAVGMMWLGFTVTFEFIFGHYVVGHPWAHLLYDYNLLQGRLWVLVLVWTVFAPLAVFKLRGL